MKLNKKLVELLLKSTNHFEIVGELDVYGNGTILEIGTQSKLYIIKSNWCGTTCNNVILANTVKKEINQCIEILKEKGFEQLD